MCLVSTTMAQDYSYLVPDQYKLRTIVIDAGHGGYDKGAVGYHKLEKRITLDVANQLSRELSLQLPGVKILQTRTSDQFITLKERAQFANRNQADLFISIHCNAGSKSASGSEIYVFGNSASQEAMQVAMRENNTIFIEDAYHSNYGGADPSQPMFYNYLPHGNAYSGQSRSLANYIQHALTTSGRANRGVKQAGFIVLKETVMPSILIETGFITNSREENYLASTRGQGEIVQSIVSGVKTYKAELDAEAERIMREKQEEIARLEAERLRREAEQAEARRQAEEERKRREAAEAEARRLAEIERLRKLESAWAWPSVRSLELEGENYMVQLVISKKYDEKEFPFENMVMSRIDVIDSYKYLIGPLATKEEAEKLHKEAQAAGFRNAFILRYVDGKVKR